LAPTPATILELDRVRRKFGVHPPPNVLFAVDQKLFEYPYQIVDPLQIIPVDVVVLRREGVREIDHLDRGPELRLLLGAQLVQDVRVVLPLALHVLVVVVLERVRPLQRPDRLLPDVVGVVVRLDEIVELLELGGRRGRPQDGPLLGQLAAEPRRYLIVLAVEHEQAERPVQASRTVQLERGLNDIRLEQLPQPARVVHQQQGRAVKVVVALLARPHLYPPQAGQELDDQAATECVFVSVQERPQRWKKTIEPEFDKCRSTTDLVAPFPCSESCRSSCRICIIGCCRFCKLENPECRTPSLACTLGISPGTSVVRVNRSNNQRRLLVLPPRS
jgi:hypothetical protein